MNIREVTVGGLIDFINSKEYTRINPKPITPLRAYSQAKNPAARSEDVALVYIAAEDKLIAFAGLLPDEPGEGSKPVYSNSGWWSHPELGRKYGLSVFLKAFQACNRRMFFTDCTSYTKEILEKTGMFDFKEPVEGKRYMLRSYLNDYWRRKGGYRLFSGLFNAVDNTVNYFLLFRISKWSKKYLPQGYSVQILHEVDEKLNAFIINHANNHFLRQDGDKLNWIAKNKWLSTDRHTDKLPYPFSQVAEKFKQEFVVIKSDNRTVAMFFLSWRDNHVSIPYTYYNKDHLHTACVLLIKYVVKQKACSLIVFRPEIIKILQEVEIPSAIQLKLTRYVGFSKELSKEFSGDKIFQDGEGDVAFT